MPSLIINMMLTVGRCVDVKVNGFIIANESLLAFPPLFISYISYIVVVENSNN